LKPQAITLPMVETTKKVGVARARQVNSAGSSLSAARYGSATVSSIGTPITAITRPMCRGPAVCASTLIPTGKIKPPPNHSRTRKKIKELADQAMPHSAEPAANTATDTIRTPL
jgi:hypothetical protein